MSTPPKEVTLVGDYGRWEASVDVEGVTVGVVRVSASSVSGALAGLAGELAAYLQDVLTEEQP